MGVNSKLPSIKELYTDSWRLLKKSSPNLLAILFLQLLGFFIVTATFALLFGSSIQISNVSLINLLLSNSFDLSILKDIDIQIFSFWTLIVLLFAIAILLISLLTNISSILILNSANKNIPILSTVKYGTRFLGNLLIANTLIYLLVFFGSFALIVPALIFSLLFLFVPFEVVLEKKRDIQALKSSLYLVSSHFFPILIRLAALLLTAIAIGMIIPKLIDQFLNIPALKGLITIFLNIILGWFTLAYSLVLYKQVKAITPAKEQIKITWVWVITILGILIASVVLGTTLTQL